MTPRTALVRLCAAGFAAYCSYAICRTPLLPLFARELGADAPLVGFVMGASTITGISISTGAPSLIGAVAAYAAGVATTTAATGAFITDVSRRARYGAAHGVFGTIYDIGDALGPITAGLLVATIGYSHMFQVLATVGLSMAIAFSFASRSSAGQPLSNGA